MDFNQLLQQLGVFLPILAIIVGLFVAWVVARIGAFLVRRAFESLKVDERASSSLDAKTQITKWASGVTFWVLFVFVLWQLSTLAVRFIGIPASTVDPLGELFNEWLPRIVNVAVFFVVAWLIASVLRFLVVKVLEWTRVNERWGDVTDQKSAARVNQSIGRAVFWLTFLVFMPSILGSLGLGETAASVQGLVDQLLGFVPGIVAAIIILILGTLLARIIRQIVTGFLEGVGADRVGERFGFSKEQNAQPLSTLLGTVVYVIVMVTVIGQALAALNLGVLTNISEQILGSVTGVILGVLGATVVLGIAYYVAKFVADVASSLLAGIGLNRLPEALGFKTTKGADLSGAVGYIVLIAIMLFAIQGTAESFGLASIAAVMGSLIALGGKVLLGLAIFVVGIYLANVAANVITTASGGGASVLAAIARWAILIFVAGIALTQAGVTLAANVIQILLITIGAAAALAFGLGGRDAAAKQLDKWFSSMPEKPSASDKPTRGKKK